MVDKSIHISSHKREKGRTWTSNMLGHCLQAEQQFPPFCWCLAAVYLLLGTKHSLTCPLHVWSRHWKLANHFLQREKKADRLTGWSADKFERFNPQQVRRWGQCVAPKKDTETFKALLFLHHCLKGWGFSRKWLNKVSMMLLWFPAYLTVAFCVSGHF